MRIVPTEYLPGRPKGACMRCGFVYRLDELSLEWSGLRVCEHCHDPLPDTMRPPRNFPEGLPRPDASPEPPDTFVQGQIDPFSLTAGIVG